MKKSSLKLLLIALMLTLSSSLTACGNAPHEQYGRTINGKLGYYQSEGRVLPLDGSGLQFGCALPAGATYKSEPLIDTSFDCHP